MKITVVIPVYDNLSGLVNIVKWIKNVLPKYCESYSVIVYNDNEKMRKKSEYADITTTPRKKRQSIE